MTPWTGTAGLNFLAGDVSAEGHFDAPLPYATFNRPTEVALDRAGNKYVIDGSALRRISAAGQVTTLVPYHESLGTGTLVVGAEGTPYVASAYDHVLYRLNSANQLELYAGKLGAIGTADGARLDARFDLLGPMAVDAQGNLLVADTHGGTFMLRQIAPDGTVSTRYTDNRTWGVAAMAVAADGSVYLATLERLVRLSPSGTLSTIAGVDLESQIIDGDAQTARFANNRGLAIGADGALYLTNWTTVRRVAQDGSVTTYAGAALSSGSADGPRTSARFSKLVGLATDSDGSLLVVDADNHAVRRISPSGEVSLYAGSGLNSTHADGQGAAAGFAQVSGVGADCNGSVLVVDAVAHVVQRVSREGNAVTIGGTPGQSGYRDGALAQALFNSPGGVVGDPDGTLYVADTGNHVIRKISPSGEVSTLAGVAGQGGSTDGPRGTGLLDVPSKLALLPDGALAVVDYTTVRRVEKDGTLRTLAGYSEPYFSRNHADGKGTAAGLVGPAGIIADKAGNIYISEGTYNARPYAQSSGTIRRITPDGTVTTIAGAAALAGFADGPAGTSRLSDPAGLALDAAGNLYIADRGNNAIRMLTPAGELKTVLGAPARAGFLPGALATASIEQPAELVFSGGALVISARNGLAVLHGLP